MIGERFNFEDVFFRDLTVCVLDTLEGQVKWINRFTSGDVFVQVPFYYSLTGDERFLLDSFADDIVSEKRARNKIAGHDDDLVLSIFQHFHVARGNFILSHYPVVSSYAHWAMQ